MSEAEGSTDESPRPRTPDLEILLSAPQSPIRFDRDSDFPLFSPWLLDSPASARRSAEYEYIPRDAEAPSASTFYDTTNIYYSGYRPPASSIIQPDTGGTQRGNNPWGRVGNRKCEQCRCKYSSLESPCDLCRSRNIGPCVKVWGPKTHGFENATTNPVATSSSDSEFLFESILMNSADGDWLARMKLFTEMLRMDDPTFAEHLLGDNDETLRPLASKLNQLAKSLLTDAEPSRTPQSTQRENQSLTQQPPMNDMQLLISHDLQEPNRDVPKLSQVILLSEIPSDLRNQVLDFLHRRESERVSGPATELPVNGGNDSGTDTAQCSQTSITGAKGSSKAPKFFYDLGLSGWELKDRRDAYRLATAAGLRTLKQAGFDLKRSWTSRSEKERENAVNLFRATLKGILADSGNSLRWVCETYLKEKCRQGVKDKKKSSRTMAGRGTPHPDMNR